MLFRELILGVLRPATGATVIPPVLPSAVRELHPQGRLLHACIQRGRHETTMRKPATGGEGGDRRPPRAIGGAGYGRCAASHEQRGLWETGWWQSQRCIFPSLSSYEAGWRSYRSSGLKQANRTAYVRPAQILAGAPAPSSALPTIIRAFAL